MTQPGIDEALARLKEGNARFVAHAAGNLDAAEARRELTLPREQNPFAIILGCSDARVPAELVFDQGPGDLFVIRVAGNIVAPSQLGSMEFAATNFGTPLIVVLGHARCGAVAATIDALTDPDPAASRNLQAIVRLIEPAVRPLLPGDGDRDALVARAVRANVAAAAARIRTESVILRNLLDQGRVAVIGAEYCLGSGRVEFFDAP